MAHPEVLRVLNAVLRQSTITVTALQRSLLMFLQAGQAETTWGQWVYSQLLQGRKMSRARCPFQVKIYWKGGGRAALNPCWHLLCIPPPEQAAGPAWSSLGCARCPSMAGLGQEELRLPSNPNHPGLLWIMVLERLKGWAGLFLFSWEPQFYSQRCCCLCCCCVTLSSKSRFCPKGKRPSAKTPLENVWSPKLPLCECK